MLDFDRMRQLIDALEVALKYGYSTKSSPIKPLIGVMVDLSLQIKNLLEESATWEERKNPSLKDMSVVDLLDNKLYHYSGLESSLERGFSEYKEIADLYGNPKMIKIAHQEKPKKPHRTVLLFFKKLAEQLIRIKRNPDSPVEFHVPTGVKASSLDRQIRTAENHHFYRRTRKRRSQ